MIDLGIVHKTPTKAWMLSPGREEVSEWLMSDEAVPMLSVQLAPRVKIAIKQKVSSDSKTGATNTSNVKVFYTLVSTLEKCPNMKSSRRLYYWSKTPFDQVDKQIRWAAN